MEITVKYFGSNWKANLKEPIDISIPLNDSKPSINAWGSEKPEIKPVERENWIGSVKSGSSVNFNNIFFNPHSHVTHTECVGHISVKKKSINQLLKKFVFFSNVISIRPEISQNGDKVITLDQVTKKFVAPYNEALIIRTLPNTNKKLDFDYTNTNPTYMDYHCAKWLSEIGVKHILIDVPSIDKEKDDGKLSAHKAYWNYPKNPKLDFFITEFIYVPNTVNDGIYLLFLNFAPIENDASPSRPIIFKLKKL